MRAPRQVEMEIASRLRRQLLELARHQDDLAADAAAATPYWKPQPVTTYAHRSAAEILRAEADRLLDTVREQEPRGQVMVSPPSTARV